MFDDRRDFGVLKAGKVWCALDPPFRMQNEYISTYRHLIITNNKKPFLG